MVCRAPAVMEGARPDERALYEYSSPVDGSDVSWRVGQRGETRIYQHILCFARR